MKIVRNALLLLATVVLTIAFPGIARADTGFAADSVADWQAEANEYGYAECTAAYPGTTGEGYFYGNNNDQYTFSCIDESGNSHATFNIFWSNPNTNPF